MISSYKELMHNPATSEIWQMAFGKDFGGMDQGSIETGHKGTNLIFVMTHTEIHNIPKFQTVAYACLVANPLRIRIPTSGNLIHYLGKLLKHTANLTTSKLMLNSILSAEGAKYLYAWISNIFTLLHHQTGLNV